MFSISVSHCRDLATFPGNNFYVKSINISPYKKTSVIVPFKLLIMFNPKAIGISLQILNKFFDLTPIKR